MQNPYFSIITPTYNCLDYLKRCINSIENQKYRKFEHVIVDDGSSNETKNYLLKNKKSYQKIIFLSHSGLPGIGRNIGIKKASGKYLCFLDSDDTFSPEKLEVLYKETVKENFDLIYHDEFIINKYKIEKFNYPSARFINKDNLVKYGNRLSTSTITLRKEFLLKRNLFFSELKNHRIVEDYHLWIKILSFNPNIKKINKYLSSYIIHNEGISSNKDQLLKNENSAILDLHKHYFINNNELDFAIKRLQLISNINSQINLNLLIRSFFKYENFVKYMSIILFKIREIILKILRIY